MTASGQPPAHGRIAMVDPSRRVPAYDADLTAALARQGAEVHLHAGPPLFYRPAHATGVIEHATFGRLLDHGLGRRAARAPRLRRALRLTYPLELAAFLRWVMRARPAIVHWQWSLAPGLDAVACRRLRRGGFPIAFTAHNVLPHERRPWHAMAFRALYLSANAVIVHSDATRRRLEELAPHLRGRVHTVAMPPPSAACPFPGGRSAARSALGLPSDAPMVLFFGHRRDYKGLETLTRAQRQLRESLPAARLLVAGPADLPQGLDTHGVDFFPGPIPEGSLATFFAAADVVALPYRDTDDSAVLAAAMGAGRAVVATQVGGIEEALDGAGLMVAAGDAGAMAQALSEVLSQVTLRRRFEDRARERAAAWSWDDAAMGTLAVYQEAARNLLPCARHSGLGG